MLAFIDTMPAIGVILEGLRSMAITERQNPAFDRGE